MRRRITWPRLAAGAGICSLVALSVWLRTRSLGQPYWIDEALSVGISSHPIGEIPGLLRQDGSPPGYYLLLRGWIQVFGDGESATGALSLMFAIACIPAGFWSGRALFGPAAGWFAAALLAFVPFLTTYAQETRMYALVVLLGLLATSCLVLALRDGGRAPAVAFAVALSALLYTHNWGLFLFAAAALVLAGLAASGRREHLTGPALGLAAAGLAYLPWAPTLLYQAEHTGAPWSIVPSLGDVAHSISGGVLGGIVPTIAVIAAAGALGARALRAQPRERTAAAAIAALLALTVTLAWAGSQLEPAWATRYFAVVVGGLLVLAGAALRRAGAIGALALVVVCAVWLGYRAPNPTESSERAVASRIGPLLDDGDLVVSTQPERLPAVAHYLPGRTFASPFGGAPDPHIMDWRDALPRLRDARPQGRLDVLVHAVPPGQRIAIVRPLTGAGERWRSRWNRLVRRRSAEWSRAASEHALLRRVASFPRRSDRFGSGVLATVYEVRQG